MNKENLQKQIEEMKTKLADMDEFYKLKNMLIHQKGLTAKGKHLLQENFRPTVMSNFDISQVGHHALWAWRYCNDIFHFIDADNNLLIQKLQNICTDISKLYFIYTLGTPEHKLITTIPYEILNTKNTERYMQIILECIKDTKKQLNTITYWLDRDNVHNLSIKDLIINLNEVSEEVNKN